jgi:hypothetical protein
LPSGVDQSRPFVLVEQEMTKFVCPGEAQRSIKIVATSTLPTSIEIQDNRRAVLRTVRSDPIQATIWDQDLRNCNP